MKICSIEGCGRTVHARGYCNAHYIRNRKFGNPTAGGTKYATPEDAFANRRREDVGGCTIWTGSLTEDGYGRFGKRTGMKYAHRYAWEHAHGPVTEGLVVDHMCFNRACVNVDHMRLVTRKQNSENRKGPESRNKSGYRGVHWHKATGKWRAKVTNFGVAHYGGYFDDPELANEAAIKLRARIFTHNVSDRG